MFSISNIQEWIKNNSSNLSLILCVLAVLLITYGLLYKIGDLVPSLPTNTNIENFVVPQDDISVLNTALNSIVTCRSNGAKCDSDKIKNFQDLKSKIWPDFNVLLFHDLLSAFEVKKAALTDEEINKIVNKDSNPKFQNSFGKKVTPSKPSTPSKP